MAKAKAATEKAAKAEPKKEREKAELTPNEIKVLTVLSKSKGPMTRQELSKKTGIVKGWSRIFGAIKDNGGDGLQGRKLVSVSLPDEGERGLKYAITALGKQTLLRVEKAAA